MGADLRDFEPVRLRDCGGRAADAVANGVAEVLLGCADGFVDAVGVVAHKPESYPAAKGLAPATCAGFVPASVLARFQRLGAEHIRIDKLGVSETPKQRR